MYNSRYETGKQIFSCVVVDVYTRNKRLTVVDLKRWFQARSSPEATPTANADNISRRGNARQRMRAHEATNSVLVGKFLALRRAG